MVEFGLAVMLLMTLMLGVVEFSRAVYTYHFVSHAARQAARWAAVNGSSCNNDRGYATDKSNLGSCTAPVTCSGSGCSLCTSTSSASCFPANNTTDIPNYVKMITPEGINPDAVATAASWPLTSVSPTNCDSSSTYYVAENSPGCTVQVTVSYPLQFVFPFIHTGTVQLSSTAQSIITH